jgi:hypothetical protein
VSTIQYVAGSELPSIDVTWRDSSGDVIDLTAYTLSLRMQLGSNDPILKVSGLTPAASEPNVVITWSDGELDIPPGVYSCQLWAKRIADGLDRDPYTFRLQILAAIPTP